MKTGVRGDLIEVNSRLVEDPNILLEEDPEAEAYIGILQIKSKIPLEFVDEE